MRLLSAVVGLGLALGLTSPASAGLTQVTSFGTNPGGLLMWEYVPANLPAGRPLVVVLHGCTQTAANMVSAGWNALADQYQFAVLYPEQATANNPVRCFNWAGEYGDPANLVRGQGENQSIISMVDTAIAAHKSDATKVYAVGFSAGGAFAVVLAATWPEKFAGIAVMSGLPYRCATTVNGAYSCQNPGTSKTSAQWGDLVRGASTQTKWPKMQIWHGSSDTTVVPMNQGELVKQWANVYGIDETADETEMIGSVATRKAYKGTNGILLETYTVSGMNHATAIGAEGMTPCPATTGAYFDNKGICATLRAAKFLGIVPNGGGNPGVDAANPTVSVLAPASGDNVTGQVTIVVAAGDDVGVASVDLRIDGKPQAQDTTAPYQWEWDATAAGTGTHTIEALATDMSGKTAMATAMVTVPADGGGSGSGSGSDDEVPAGPGALPACSLNASGVGASGWAPIAMALAAVVGFRRRRRN